MPNTSQQSQLQTPGSFSGYEVMPAAEVVMFEKPLIVEAQTSPEVFPTPITEPTPIRKVQHLPLTSDRVEAPTSGTLERAVADRAQQAAVVIIGQRTTAARYTLHEQGLR